MTDVDPLQSAPGSLPPKEPAPGLTARAAPPHAVRLRKSVVQVLVIGGAALVSGSLAWAFVVQPELRDSARARQAEAREEQTRGVVRPSEAVTDQPASYDRLPEPRLADVVAKARTLAADSMSKDPALKRIGGK